jgi:small-conductance mechanosensitive channel
VKVVGRAFALAPLGEWGMGLSRHRCAGARPGARLLLAILVSAGGLALPASLATGGTEAPTPEIDRAREYSEAPVTVDGRVLFVVRGIAVYPAAERARLIGERIRAVAADRAFSAGSLQLVQSEHGTDIVAGSRLLITVTDADAAREGAPRALVAEALRLRIATAISTYRAERTPSAVLIDVALAAGITLGAWLLLVAVHRFFRRLEPLADQSLAARLEALEARSFRLVQAGHISAALHGAVRGLRLLVFASIAYVALYFVLDLFPWTRLLARDLASILFTPAATIATAVLETLPNLAFIAILALLLRYVLRLVRLFFEGIANQTITLSRFDPEWAWPSYRIVSVTAIVFALIVAYPYIPGSGTAAFQGVSLFIGVVVSLGASSFIANLIAGYTMIYRRAFRLGDRIRVAEQTGDVLEIGALVTRLRTIKNEEVVLPNSMILTGHVTNYSTLARTSGLILHTTVGIGYDTPWRQVEAMLLMAASRTPGVPAEPPPFVLQTRLGDFAVTYELNVYCDDAQAMAARYSALHRNVQDVFNEHGVQIMTPAYENDPAQPKVAPRDQWYVDPTIAIEPARDRRNERGTMSRG